MARHRNAPRLLALAALVLVVLAFVLATAEGIRRVPPAEETQRRLAEEEAGAGASKEWCLEAGFNPEKLKCGTCDKLAGVVLVEDAAKKTAGEALVDECRRCCQAGRDAAKYARAVLETDEFFLKFLEPFKKLKASDEVAAWEKAGALAFETKTGVRPTLHLFAPGATEPAETVSVASWTTESMLEFLQDSIPAASTAAAKGGEKTKKDGSKAAQHEEL